MITPPYRIAAFNPRTAATLVLVPSVGYVMGYVCMRVLQSARTASNPEPMAETDLAMNSCPFANQFDIDGNIHIVAHHEPTALEHGIPG
jgi:hypothetical protein